LRFQRAHILMSQDRYEEALADLLIIEQQSPKEAPLHALLAQCYQHLNNVQESLLHYNIALDLDPKESNNIKVS
jgi:anaphase-promoting complex subunit 3